MTHKFIYHKYLSDDFLEEFKNYNQIMEKYLLMNYLKFSNNLDIGTNIKFVEYELLLKYSKSLFEESTFYPQSFRTSFFIQIFSILEHELKEICLIHYQYNKSIFSIADLKGNSDIEKAKLYLKKADNIDFDDLGPEWNYLDTMRKIRNRFVHSQGEINQKHPDWNKIYSFVNLHKNLLGFRNSEEYLEKNELDHLFSIGYIFSLNIQNNEFNENMILNVKKFLYTLTNKLKI